MIDDLAGVAGDRSFTRADIVERHDARYGPNNITPSSLRSYLSSMVKGNRRKPYTTEEQPLERDGHRYRLRPEFRPTRDIEATERSAASVSVVADRHARRRLAYARSAVAVLDLVDPYDPEHLPGSPQPHSFEALIDSGISKVDAIVLDPALPDAVAIAEGIGRAVLMADAAGFEKFMVLEPAAVEALDRAELRDRLLEVASTVTFGVVNGEGRWLSLRQPHRVEPSE